MNLQIARWGNSFAMRLPAELVRRLGLREGDTLAARLSIDGALTLRPANWSRRDFAAELDAARAALPLGTPVVAALRESSRY